MIFWRQKNTKNASTTNGNVHSKPESGHSLPEILIGFVILTILAVASMPAGFTHIRLYRLETSVSFFASKLSETKMQAINQNRSSWLRLDKDARTAQIQTTDSVGTTVDVGPAERFPENLVLDAADSVEIGFDSMGRLSPGGSSFILQDPSSNIRKSVTVSASGKVAVGQVY